MLILAFSLLSFLFQSQAEDGYGFTYYVFLRWETDSAFVCIVAAGNNTKVKIFPLPEFVPLAETSLESMKKLFVPLSSKGAYKIVSDSPVYVLLFSGVEIPGPDDNAGPVPVGFHTSVQGTYIGKEFVLFVSQGLTGEPYRILALEKSKVTVYEDDKVYESFELEANEYKDLSFPAFETFRIVSTGHIMIQSGSPGDRSFLIPTAEGGFVGKTFFFKSRQWHPATNSGFKILALDDTKVTVWNVESRRKIQELSLQAGKGSVIRPVGDEIMLESEKPIVLSYVHNWTKAISRGWDYATGVTYMGVKANQETVFFLPLEGTAEAYIFAYEDTYVEIDDVPLTLKADHYYRVDRPGAHKIISGKNVVIQIIHDSFTIPESKGFAVVIPSVETIDVASGVHLSPLITGDDTLYIAAAVIFTLIVVGGISFFALRRRRSAGP
jgi:hypothetical protein